MRVLLAVAAAALFVAPSSAQFMPDPVFMPYPARATDCSDPGKVATTIHTRNTFWTDAEVSMPADDLVLIVPEMEDEMGAHNHYVYFFEAGCYVGWAQMTIGQYHAFMGQEL